MFDSWKFDEWYLGSGLWEDVHFSYQVGKHYELVVVADAWASHREYKLSPQDEMRLGRRQVTNWAHFVSENPELSLTMCLWGGVGRTCSNLVKGMARMDRNFIMRGLGNGLGLAGALVGIVRPPA